MANTQNRVADVTNWGDPNFSWCSGGDTRCRMGFANYINGGSNIYTYASASWAFFSGPGYQACASDQCQSKSIQHWNSLFYHKANNDFVRG